MYISLKCGIYVVSIIIFSTASEYLCQVYIEYKSFFFDISI